MLLQKIESGGYSGSRGNEEYERDNLYLGILNVKYENIAHDLKGNVEKRDGTLKCRKILFTLDEDNLARDLIWNTPNYQVSGFIPQVPVEDERFVVNSVVGLSPLLIYKRYPELLNDGQVKEIYKKYLKNDKFYLKNSELFGYVKRVVDDFLNKFGTNQGSQFVYCDDSPLISRECWRLGGMSMESGDLSSFEKPASKRLKIKL